MHWKFLQGNIVNYNYNIIDYINILVHCVNDEGVMGGGVAKAIAEKWPNVELQYRTLFDMPAKDRRTAQGQIQLVLAELSVYVCNLFGQSSIGDIQYLPAIRYGAVEEGLLRLK